MLIPVTLLVAGFFLVLARLPTPLLKRYGATFRARHGVGVQVGLVVLATITGSMLLATALQPGHLLMELVDGAVVAGLGLAALIDLYLFRRR
jgi:hypothetical protein